MTFGLLKKVNENFNVEVFNCTNIKTLSIKQLMREVRQHSTSHTGTVFSSNESKLALQLS